jgi:hypothetical protein
MVIKPLKFLMCSLRNICHIYNISHSTNINVYTPALSHILVTDIAITVILLVLDVLNVMLIFNLLSK